MLAPEVRAALQAIWAGIKAALKANWDATKFGIKADWAAQKAEIRAERLAIAQEIRAGWADTKSQLKADRKERIKELRTWWKHIKEDLKTERKEKAQELRAGWAAIKAELKAKWAEYVRVHGKLTHTEILRMRAEWSQAASDYRDAWAAEIERRSEAWAAAIRAYKEAWATENTQYRAAWTKAIADYRAAWDAEIERRKPEWPKKLAEYKATWANAVAKNKEAWSQALAENRARWQAAKVGTGQEFRKWGWRKLIPWKLTKAGAMPGELWDPNLSKYILIETRDVIRVRFFFTDGTTYLSKWRPTLAFSVFDLADMLATKLKKTVDRWQELDKWSEYKIRVPPLPGPVLWPKWKQNVEDWRQCSGKDLYTKGNIPEALWSDRLKRYILPTLPRRVQRFKVTFSDMTTQEIISVWGVTSHIEVMSNELAQKLGKDWIRHELIEEWFRYKSKPYEKSGQSRWHLPFDITEIVNEEFEKKKAEYNAQWGYSVEMPGWGDIFHYKLPLVMSAEEKLAWKTKQYDLIPAARRAEIQEYKANKKIKFQRMLASPTPKILRAFGAYSTMVDNAQDTIVTAAMLGRIAIKTSPKFMKRAVPVVGWAMVAADILNVMSLFALMPFLTQAAKRGHWSFSALNPWSKEAKLRRAAKMMKWIPSFGDILQALQVSDSVCGVGICLGPVLGCVEDLIAGTVRTALGERVAIGWAGPIFPTHVMQAHRALTAVPQVEQGGQVLTDEEHMLNYYALLGATRIVTPYWNSLEAVDNMDGCNQWYIEAPAPKDILTLELLDELGIDIEKTRLWPSTGKRWSSVQELAESTAPAVVDNLTSLVERTKKNEAFIPLGSILTELAPETLALYGGEHEVEVSHTAETMVCTNLLARQYYFPYDIKQDQINKLADRIHRYDQMYNETPPLKEVISWGTQLGITWRHELPREPMGKAAEIWPDYLDLKAQYGEESYLA